MRQEQKRSVSFSCRGFHAVFPKAIRSIAMFVVLDLQNGAAMRRSRTTLLSRHAEASLDLAVGRITSLNHIGAPEQGVAINRPSSARTCDREVHGVFRGIDP